MIVIIAYACIAFVMSQVADFNKGPDEETNLAYVEFILTYGRLPITYDERTLIGKDSNWPALYHLIVGRVSNTLGIKVEDPPYIKIFWDSFRYRVIDAGKDWYYLRTEDQLWPYLGRILVLHIGRWLSLLFGVVTLLLVYGVVLELLPSKSWLALVAVAIVAFVPSYTFISSVMNEDTMMAALATLYLWMLILVIKEPKKFWPYLVMGLALGISVTVKYTTIILPLEVVVVLAILAWQEGYTWRWWAQQVAIVGGSAILASSWWFGWNFWYLNEINKLGWITGLLRPIFTGGPDVTLSRLGYFLSGGEIGLSSLPERREVGTFADWIQKTALSFWGVSINEIIPLSPYAYMFMGLILLMAAFGLWQLWLMDASARKWVLLLIFHVSIFFILPLLRFALSRRIGETAQGRHILLPTVAAVIILIVWGLQVTISQRWQRWVFPLIVAGFVVWTGAHVDRLIKFTPVPVPMRTVPQAAEWLSQTINAKFGDSVELVSYEINAKPNLGLLQVNLAWRSLAHIQENYLLRVSLLDAEGQVVSYWVGYNGQGIVPTLAWDPGDTVFDRLTLPILDLPAGNYTLHVQLVDSRGSLTVYRDHADQNVSDGQPSQDTYLALTDVSLERPANETFSRSIEIMGEQMANPIKLDFDLWQADGPNRSNQPTYRYPATISIVTSHSDVDLALIGDTGQAWPPTSSAANIHTFVIGPRWQSGNYRLQVSLQEDKVSVGQTMREPLLKVENWWEREFEAPMIENVKEANFANQIMLLGYNLPQSNVKAGEAFPVTLYWQAPSDRSPQASFTQFNHLLDSEGTLRGGYDRQPLEYYDTLLWAPGEVVIDGYTVQVEADAPPGLYYLNLGYYLTVGESAVNLPLVVEGQMTDMSSVTIGPVEVVE